MNVDQWPVVDFNQYKHAFVLIFVILAIVAFFITQYAVNRGLDWLRSLLQRRF